jgi:uncharacterized iron-regulated membrane protein
MKKTKQQEAATTPLEPYRGDYPGRLRGRLIVALVVGFIVIVLVAGAVLFLRMNNKIRHLETTTSTQSAQIHHLQSTLAAEHASLSAAVACLQTVGATEGLCSQLVK